MPESVSDMVQKAGDVLSFNRKILTNIYHAYLFDMNKYIFTETESLRIESIYQSIPSQIGNQSHKFQYGKVKKSARARDYESAMNWLISSRMVYPCKAVSVPNAPLTGFQYPDVFKLFINDPGLLCSLLGIRLPDVMLDGDYSYKGVIVENYVASHLAAQQIPLYYWRVESKYEVDFIIDTPDGIVPLEVKSGGNKRSASMDMYRKQFSPPYVIRITANNFGGADGIRSVPLYAAHCIGMLTGF
jgi:predicted AAA+ superfamily ATPase